eukprot:69430-Amphidinium_carterae.1
MWNWEGEQGDLLSAPCSNRHQRDVFNFFKSICCEINGSQYVVNAPWVIVKIFRVVASVLPQNFVNKLHLMDSCPQPVNHQRNHTSSHLSRLLVHGIESAMLHTKDLIGGQHTRPLRWAVSKYLGINFPPPSWKPAWNHPE